MVELNSWTLQIRIVHALEASQLTIVFVAPTYQASELPADTKRSNANHYAR